MTKQANNDIVTIKKYANRRLYNTQTSCYIVLEDLFDMIKRGEEFVVKDAKTEEDITRSVLTQIIFEQEAKGYNLLPINFLRQLIGMYGNTKLEGVVPSYLTAMMEQFIQNQEKMVNFSSADWTRFTPIKMFENMTEQNMKIFESTLGMFAPKKDDK
ncbi:MAG: polyhydroxyalkanoate synthesis repressor PhaR [Rickettsiales bacterium]|nr:polyhydroxyalkanoate synthesis repressor PhaR [Pseudomonadota bacterium]MDA0965776.1 polyhydroxyalkanoate synthesis repressor PhaR [Pseudomonadota bacterium]MDG4543762.1 polyhydroxyalkanoate synthesis repressor PhaR [Rickettsiales bacterium]MDG4545909.1 polyhydroxyalkanoate synthesis repressor PhaR [Rickettsiales bacterium]MDG4548155.1 polyhydroxyalkanoate synthesis repressor PhaR [Rickettsiales bacterium]